MKDFVIIDIQDGAPKNERRLERFYKSLRNGSYEISAKKAGTRSNQQNRYYFGIVVPLIQKGIKDLGTELTKEETHEFLKAKFNADEIQVVDKNSGELLYESIPKSTTRLNKEDFSAYTEQIQRWAAEFLSIIIPDPGSQTILSYEDH